MKYCKSSICNLGESKHAQSPANGRASSDTDVYVVVTPASKNSSVDFLLPKAVILPSLAHSADCHSALDDARKYIVGRASRSQCYLIFAMQCIQEWSLICCNFQDCTELEHTAACLHFNKEESGRCQAVPSKRCAISSFYPISTLSSNHRAV